MTNSSDPFTVEDHRFMSRAIQLAKKGWFTTRSNPRVGCVITRDGEVISEGWHEKTGCEHAELNALKSSNEDLSGTTAYVTLEPCSHHGKKPPCSLALIKKGVSRVICAMQDPNPLVSGEGIKQLEEAGIQVSVGLMQSEAENLNRGFLKRMTKNLPRVVIKSAISLDGKVAMASGESQWITSKDARIDVQKLRAESGAIITGSGTVVSDDPSLNVRAIEFIKDQNFTQPLRVVIDSQHLVSAGAKIFKQDGETWLASGGWSSIGYPDKVNQEIFSVLDNGKIDLKELLLKLASQGINDVLVEAGPKLATAFIEQKLADELIVYMAPKLMGSNAQSMITLPLDKMNQSISLSMQDIRQIGSDLKITYSIEK